MSARSEKNRHPTPHPHTHDHSVTQRNTAAAQRNNPLTQLPVLTVVAPFLTSLGTFPAPRLQNQTFTNAFVRSIAYQPPPAPLNAAPKLFAPWARTPHPALPFTFASQLVWAVVLFVDPR